MKIKLVVNPLLKKFLISIIVIKGALIPLEMSAQENSFPYQLKKIDYALVPVGLTLQIGGGKWIDNQEIITMKEIALLNRNNVNGFDRSATFNFSGSFDNISDITRTSLVILPGLLVGHQLIKKEWKNAITYGIMYYEAYLFAEGITAMVKASTHRTRPYLYNDELTVEERYEYTKIRDSYGSFFSGHTAAMFASAVMLSKTFTDIYGESVWSTLLWATTLTAASVFN